MNDPAETMFERYKTVCEHIEAPADWHAQNEQVYQLAREACIYLCFYDGHSENEQCAKYDALVKEYVQTLEKEFFEDWPYKESLLGEQWYDKL